jgi:hypothetical protein
MKSFLDINLVRFEDVVQSEPFSSRIKLVTVEKFVCLRFLEFWGLFTDDTHAMHETSDQKVVSTVSGHTSRGLIQTMSFVYSP